MKFTSRGGASALAALLAVVTSIAAANTPPVCLPDSNGDGHPMFGSIGVTLAPPNHFGNFWVGAVAADLDGDGDIDVATANSGGLDNPANGSVSILLNDGDGVLRPTAGVPNAGAEPRHIVAADLDGDGDIDLAVADSQGNRAKILLNNGNATFQVLLGYVVGTRPRSIACGDIDGDGDIDLATLNATADSVTVLRNQGGGVFGGRTDIQLADVGNGNCCLPVGGCAILLVDLDGDGDRDLAAAVTNSNIVSILWNTGGVFGAPQDLPVGGGPISIAAGDVDGDGTLDLVTANSHLHEGVSVVKNLGGGNFAPSVDYAANGFGYPVSNPQILSQVSLGDLNNDGSLDIAVGLAGDKLSLLVNQGNGTFGAEHPRVALMSPMFVLAKDFNADGRTDLLALGFFESSLSVILNTGGSQMLGGQFEMTHETYTPAESSEMVNPVDTVVADLDNDGDQDIISAKAGQSDVGQFPECAVFMNNGAGTFVLDGAYAHAGVRTATSGDIDEDGDLDVVTIVDTIAGDSIPKRALASVMLNDGNAAFPTFTQYDMRPPGAAELPYSQFVKLIDVDNDGHLDLLASTCNSGLWSENGGQPYTGYLTVRRGDGSGAFGAVESNPTPPEAWTADLADLNGDGFVDAVVTHKLNGGNAPGFTVLFNDGNGAFGNPATYPDGGAFDFFRVAIADLDGDGDQDLVVERNSTLDPVPCVYGVCTFMVQVMLNDGTGQFAYGELFAAGPTGTLFGQTRSTLVDIDQDGALDLVTATGLSQLSVVRGRGDGTFDHQHAVAYSFWQAAFPKPVVFDIDGDSDLDVVVNGDKAKSLCILRNRRCVTPVCLADFNSSGSRTVQDLFDYLAAWFAQCDGSNPNAPCFSRDADINNSGAITVQDLFDFLAAWFAGCETTVKEWRIKQAGGSSHSSR